jgi:glutamate mutase epsilon subunit
MRKLIKDEFMLIKDYIIKYYLTNKSIDFKSLLWSSFYTY